MDGNKAACSPHRYDSFCKLIVGIGWLKFLAGKRATASPIRQNVHELADYIIDHFGQLNSPVSLVGN